MNVNLPDETLTFDIPGEEPLVIDLVETEVALDDACKVDKWVEGFQSFISERYGREISYSQAWKMANIVRQQFNDFKKKFAADLKLPEPTESTHSNSQNNKSDCSQETSQESMQNVNG